MGKGLFSPMICYCNACGWQMHQSCAKIIGRNWKVCSLRCLHEIEWRNTLSMLGEEYRPMSEPEDKE